MRDVSFTRLGKLLAARGFPARLDFYREHIDDLILATATIRMASTLGLVVVMVELCRRNETLSTSIEWLYLASFVASAALIFVIGVAIPQAWADYAGEPFLAAGPTLPLLRVGHVLTRPLTWVSRLFDGLVRRLAGVPKSLPEDENQQMEEDVLEAVKEAALQGVVDKTEKAMIESVMRLDTTTAGHIMTPRTEVVAIDKDATLDEVKALIKKEGHSRIPVYDESIDHILGMVYAKDLLHVDPQRFHLCDVLREVPFVPESKLLRDLLQEFQTGRPHAAIVLDEYGGTAGLVTIEDILEELVGEIADEYEQPEPEPIVRIADEAVEVDSRVHVEEINEALGCELPESDDYETIGGFVFSALGKIPQAGEELAHDNVKITILEAEDRRIKRLRLELAPVPARGETA